MSKFTFIAAYRFVDLADPEVVCERLHAAAVAAQLKGTVLLAHEGINLMLAGATAQVHAWLTALRADARFTTLELKEHAVASVPFKRLRVKVKNEIIRMNQPTVRPATGRAAAVSAADLKRWLDRGRCDAGRELVLLDTRNGFEVDAGAFAGAQDWRLEHFSDFPAALSERCARPEVLTEMNGKTVVTYCTGGIRCEKAALWMTEQGLPHVVQLDGGILRYLEQHPDAPHWQGQCFVFDEREGLGGTELAEVSRPQSAPSAPGGPTLPGAAAAAG